MVVKNTSGAAVENVRASVLVPRFMDFPAEAPALDLRKRLYQDFDQTPGYPDPDLLELSQPAPNGHS